MNTRKYSLLLLLPFCLALVWGMGKQATAQVAPPLAWQANPARETLQRITLPDDPNLLIAPEDTSSRSTLHPRLDGRLQTLLSLYGASDDASWGATAELLIDNTGKVLAEVRANPNAPALTRQVLEDQGGVIRHHNAPGLYEVWLPIPELAKLADDANIYFIQPARLVQPQVGASTSQAVAASFANIWHGSGITGAGRTIAIIDTFNNTGGQIAALQASGDWPPPSQLTTIRVGSGTFGSGGNNHGNAVLEIVYDMAPGATYLAYDVTTVGDWVSAIGQATAAGAHIISASLSAPLDGIGDGSALPGSVAEAAAVARAAGVLLVNAAGNYREDHWGGLYNNHATINNTHDWGAGGNLNLSPYCLPNGYAVAVDLFWDDWVNVNHDYDLYLYRYNNTGWVVAASSEAWQNGGPGQRPQEAIRYTLPGGTRNNPFDCPTDTHVVGVQVRRYSAPTNRNLQVFTNMGLVLNVPARSLGFPADSPNVLATTAVAYTTLAQQPYSSEGPILAPGGGLPVGTENPKPDFASFGSGTDTQSYGASAFAGTSAAAAHLAGWAALVWQANPGFNVSQVETRMREIAASAQGPYNNDLGSTGHDFQHGYGLARFLFSPTAVSLQTIAPQTPKLTLPVLLFLLLLAPTLFGFWRGVSGKANSRKAKQVG